MMLSHCVAAGSIRLSTLLLITAIAVVGSVGCATMGPGCGCGIAASCGGDVGCAVEPGCGCEPACGCGVEPGCGCEPSCGCGSSCGGGGCSMAGQMWCGDGCCGTNKPLINVCTGPECCGGGDPGCGCEPGCGVEPGCGCEPSCGVGGCGATCGVGCGNCPVAETLAFGVRSIGSEFRRLLSPLGMCCPCGSGCGGCDGEAYWSEWHNDPPACCDPCDQCGNWVGPSATSMRAPYDHEFSPRRVARLPESGPRLR